MDGKTSISYRMFALLMVLVILVSQVAFVVCAEEIADVLQPDNLVETMAEAAYDDESTLEDIPVIQDEICSDYTFEEFESADEIADESVTVEEPSDDSCYEESAEGSLIYDDIIEEYSEELPDESIFLQEFADTAEYEEQTVECSNEIDTDEKIPVIYPAQYFKADSSAGITVEAFAQEETFPSETSMIVYPIIDSDILSQAAEAVGPDAKRVRAVDIVFYDAAGYEIEPLQPIVVKLTSSLISDEKGAEVVHFDDNGDVSVISDTSLEGNTASFESSDFSIYAVVEVEEKANLTIVFHRNDGTTQEVCVSSDNINDDKENPKNDLSRIITDPGVGTLTDNMIFKGWIRKSDYSVEDADDGISIGQIRVLAEKWNADNDETWDYYAMVFSMYHVSFCDENNTVIFTDNLLSITGEGVSYTLNVPYVPHQANQSFEGWQTEQTDLVEGGKAPYAEGSAVTVYGNVIFTVKVSQGNWVIFQEGGVNRIKGATYVPSQFIRISEKATRPSPAPTCLGYSFVDWFEGEEQDGSIVLQNEPFDFENTDINKKTTLYAVWTEDIPSGWTVIIWKQKTTGGTDPSDYDYIDSLTIDNTSSSSKSFSVTGNVGDRNITINDKTYGWTGFKYARTVQNPSGAVSPDGNSVVNVYFDREEYTLTFKANDYTYTPSTDDYDNSPIKYGEDEENGMLRIYWRNGAFRTEDRSNAEEYDGVVYTRSNSTSGITVKEIKALYGASLADQFPIKGINNAVYPLGTRWKPKATLEVDGTTYFTDGVVVAYVDVMPPGDMTFEFNTSNAGKKTMVYWIESASGDGSYSIYKTVRANYSRITIEDFIDIRGFNKERADKNTSWSSSDNTYYYTDGNGAASTVNFYYTRQKYSILYMDGSYFVDSIAKSEPDRGQLHIEDNVVYGSDISEYKSLYQPDFTGDYVFSGWYADKTCTAEFDFTTMPAESVTVYAKWIVKAYRVFLHPNADNDPTFDIGEQSTSFKVNAGSQIAGGNSIVATRQQYELVGWFMDEACSQPFNFGIYRLSDAIAVDYSKTECTETDQYGDPEPGKENINADVDRPWVQKKFDLYAKWRRIIVGADGINVEYVTLGSEVADTSSYLDASQAIAKPGDPNPPEGKIFECWELMRWDGNQYVYVGDVYPGDAFEIKYSDALQTEDQGAPGAQKNKYTIRLVAKYVDELHELLTNIYWFSNYSSEHEGEEELYREDKGIKINQAIDILGPQKREGYKFAGWTKEKGGDTAWLIYHQADDNTEEFFTAADAGDQVVTQVAADGNQPTENLYAVWQIDDDQIYTVTYTAVNGTVSVISQTEQILSNSSITGSDASANEGYIFDGWFKDEEKISGDLSLDPVYAVENLNKTDAGNYTDTVYVAKFVVRNSVPYVIEHYKQDINGTYSAVAFETENKTGFAGTEVKAEPNSYKGFTLDLSAIGSKHIGTVSDDGNLVLKMFYSRNSYKVTYRYSGEVPAGAGSLPGVAEYKYNEEVTVAPNVYVPGYTFSGWSKSGTFKMPAENVEIVGSFSANPAPELPPVHGPETKTPEPMTESIPEPVAQPVPEPVPESMSESAPTVVPAPVFVPESAHTLASFNLLSTIGTVAIGGAVASSGFKKKEEDEEFEDEETVSRTVDYDEEEKKEEINKFKFLGIIPAFASIIASILTEDMNADTNLVTTNKWTPLMVAMLALNGVIAFVTRDKKNKDKDE